jgi:hypothetical protein
MQAAQICRRNYFFRGPGPSASLSSENYCFSIDIQDRVRWAQGNEMARQ